MRIDMHQLESEAELELRFQHQLTCTPYIQFKNIILTILAKLIKEP